MTTPVVIKRECKTIASWHTLSIEDKPFLDPPKKPQVNCVEDALAYTANVRQKVKKFINGEEFQDYTILPFAHGFANVLEQGKHVGMPTSRKGKLKKIKWYKRYNLTECKNLVSLKDELGLEKMEGGGAFVAIFEMKDDFKFDKAGDEVYKAKGKTVGEAHAVSVVGHGIERIWLDMGNGIEEVVEEPYWIYQNNWGPDWGLGKVSCDAILEAWVPYM